jgi:hypothetical protein
MPRMSGRLRSLRARFAQRRADRRVIRAERSQRRAIMGDRHRQVEHRNRGDGSGSGVAGGG